MKGSIAERFWAKVDIRGLDECWEWTGAKTGCGYGQIRVSQRGSPMMPAHRLSWELYNKQEIPGGLLVCHSCDNPGCVNPAHLFLGTGSDNKQDSLRKGRDHPPRVRGSENGKSKLTEADVYEIRYAFLRAVPVRRIARLFGVSPRCIGSIKSGRTWGWLPWEVGIETG